MADNRLSRSTSLKITPLNDRQKTRIFACICVARYIHGYRDNEENFSLDVYKKTIDLLRPHFKQIGLEREPSFPVVRRIWRNFIQFDLIEPTTEREPKYPYSDSIDGDDNNGDDDDDDNDSQQSNVSSEQENEEFLPRNRGRRKHSKEPKDSTNSSSSTIFRYGISIVLLLFSLCSILIFAKENSTILEQKHNNIKIHYERIDKISQEYPLLLSEKKLRTIRARTAMMQEEISILLLLGWKHDKSCQQDPTYCIGRTVANVTELPYGYLDASDSYLDSNTIVNELSDSFINGQKHIVLFDNLEQLKGSEVMNLFQFIDKDGTIKRQGMLIFIVYAADILNQHRDQHEMRDFDQVERILLKKWSPFVPHDTLTSVISRIGGSIVRTY